MHGYRISWARQSSSAGLYLVSTWLAIQNVPQCLAFSSCMSTLHPTILYCPTIHLHPPKRINTKNHHRFYCGGNIAGPHIFFPREAPRYLSAIKGLLIAYCIAAFVQVIYTGLCWYENKQRDAKGLHTDEECEALEGFSDLTDKENVHFRYCI